MLVRSCYTAHLSYLGGCTQFCLGSVTVRASSDQAFLLLDFKALRGNGG